MKNKIYENIIADILDFLGLQKAKKIKLSEWTDKRSFWRNRGITGTIWLKLGDAVNRVNLPKICGNEPFKAIVTKTIVDYIKGTHPLELEHQFSYRSKFHLAAKNETDVGELIIDAAMLESMLVIADNPELFEKIRCNQEFDANKAILVADCCRYSLAMLMKNGSSRRLPVGEIQKSIYWFQNSGGFRYDWSMW